MDRMSFMKRAQLKASEELKAQQPGAAPAAKPPVQPKKKRQVDEGQKKLTEAGLKPIKKSKRASPSGDAGTSVVPSGDGGGSNVDALVDHPSGPSSTTLSTVPAAVAATRKKGSSRELVKGTYKLEVEYPIKGGLFNEIVDGHEVICQAIPDEDRAYLKKLGHVKMYDGGMDHIVQGAFMLMESNRRQQKEIARLKQFEQRVASADEALGSLERLRLKVEGLKKRADEADQLAAEKEGALQRLADMERVRDEALRRAKEAEKGKASAELALSAAEERAAEAVVQKFLEVGWKDEDRLSRCFKVVAARLVDWVTKSPDGQAYWEKEMKVFYDLGQYRMQRLLYRRLQRRFIDLGVAKERAVGLELPSLMRHPEAELELPTADRQLPIESSQASDDWTYEPSMFEDTATSGVAAGAAAASAEEGVGAEKDAEALPES
ncbi:unnamed protein product [Cuscuta europaea]|uniref:Uncharacterized protein n=1 Tax=Cuscuta europaea TaxID=41803 RepID=A0A9P1E620_CUSEU|nr:unnamed protein product [Cuscuta europaea]